MQHFAGDEQYEVYKVVIAGPKPLTEISYSRKVYSMGVYYPNSKIDPKCKFCNNIFCFAEQIRQPLENGS